MFKALALALLLISSAPAFAKSKVDGDWSGTLEGANFPVVFHIQMNGTSTTDSPKQKVMGMPAVVTATGNAIRILMEGSGARFEGKLQKSIIVGTFFQTGSSWPLTLTKMNSGHSKSH